MSELAIPHERLIASLERRLHAAVSELAMRDAAIEQLQEELAAARSAVPAGMPGRVDATSKIEQSFEEAS